MTQILTRAPARTRRSTDLDAAGDAILADRAADGDGRAFTALVRRYGRLLRFSAARVVGTGGGAGDADDIVQEALITAWQQLPTLTDTAAVRGWLVKITTRKALDHLRSRRTHTDIDDLDVEPATDPAAGPEATAETDELAAGLDRALDRLPLQQRQVWTLRELGGYSYQDIALELALPAPTVRGLLARSRRTLVQQMNQWR